MKMVEVEEVEILVLLLPPRLLLLSLLSLWFLLLSISEEGEHEMNFLFKCLVPVTHGVFWNH